MKIALSQTQPIAGAIASNLGTHLEYIKQAVTMKADLIVFPELSLTGYEPRLAKTHAVLLDDAYLQIFSEVSSKHNITICFGVPLQTEEGITISMLIYQPKRALQIYTKQHLHPDEEPFFMEGNKQIWLEIKKMKVAPAICYESYVEEHNKIALKNTDAMYMVSVAKTEDSIKSAGFYYAEISKAYSTTIFAVNSVGLSDDIICGGQSGVWGSDGKIKGQLDASHPGILVYDTETEETQKHYW
ncbi:hydrolase [Neptunitalea chrysea]|uniref:Hydrolase n=1 Tax=Neptunitalea chrysea TaxID=1647581 RepID=A0A9W6B7A2_9FLAO|nr:carbon-nitrogen hydrolase family protein [Neptunitalea chrysea]GLB52587.1 hydrolase [Neptunitalea chrysea]